MAFRSLDGATVIVTGATSGIGRETAVAFAAAGASVVMAGRREERLRELVAELGPDRALAVRTDVADPAQVARLVEQAHERFGRIDVLVNNAGVGLVARFDQQSMEDFERVLAVNFWGAVHACRAVLPRMKAQRTGGVIINVSSILGKRGLPLQTAYCASKFALAGFSQALRTEVMADRVDVSTIFPGAVDTEIWQAATNLSGLEVPDVLPKYPARELARVIVDDARFPRPEIVLALDAQLINLMNTLAPGVMDGVLGLALPFIEGMRRGVPPPPAIRR